MNIGTGLGRQGIAFSILALALLFLSGCGPEEKASTAVAPKPAPLFDPMSLEIADADLIKGREIWVPTCGQCHINGLGGAPKIGNFDEWGPRIAKGKDVLYQHAIEGFLGPLLNEMPAKGGFMDLTDEEVKLAVDFVVYASQETQQ